jgi:hypothetical protein
MSIPLVFPTAHAFPSRAEEEQANPRAQTVEYLRESGITHHMEAALYTGLAAAVVGSPDPKLVSLQPTICRFNEEAWTRAYDFVKNFLAWYRMTLTQATTATELPSFESLAIRDTFGTLDRDKYFSELRGVVQPPFTEKVAAFRGVGKGSLTQ